MLNNSETFALIKSTPQALRLELRQVLKNDTNFLVEEQNSSDLSSQIISVSQSKYDADRFVVWKPDNVKNYSIFYSNYLDGWYSLLYNLIINYQREVLMIYLDPVDSKGKMGFYYYSDNKERIVRALYDNPKWTFFEKGEILPFENSEYYKKKKITDRMNNDIMKEYLLKLGVDINSPDFYKSKTSFILGKTV
jgi:hypothetical protein